jgi:hypothetical protein
LPSHWKSPRLWEAKYLTSFALSFSGIVRSNLAEVALPGATTVEYLIDSQNRRIGKKVNGALVQGLLWQGQLVPVAFGSSPGGATKPGND